MKRYLIERHIPGVGSLSRAQLKDLAATSNDAVAKLSGKVQWLHSHIAADNTFCCYSPKVKPWFASTLGSPGFR